MKKIFVMMAAVVCAGMMQAGMKATELQEEALPGGVEIQIGETKVTPANCGHVQDKAIQSGHVFYDAETRVLHLYNTSIRSEEISPMISIRSDEPVTIDVTGKCYVESSGSGGIGMLVNAPLVVRTLAGGTLYVYGTSNRGMVLGDDMTVKDGVYLSVTGGSYGILGVLRNSKWPTIKVDGSMLNVRTLGFGHAIEDVENVEAVDSDLPVVWSTEHRCAQKKGEDNYENLLIKRNDHVCYARLLSSDITGGGKVYITDKKNGQEVANPYKYKDGVAPLTLHAEDTEDYVFLEYEDKSTNKDRDVAVLNDQDYVFEAKFRYKAKTEKTWNSIYNNGLYLYKDHLLDNLYIASIGGLESEKYKLGAGAVLLNNENAAMLVYATEATEGKTAIEYKWFTLDNTTSPYMHGVWIAAQDTYHPIYAAAFSQIDQGWYFVAKKKSTGKFYILKAGISALDEAILLSSFHSEPTAMTTDQYGAFYVMESDANDGYLHKYEPYVAEGKTAYREVVSRVGAASSNAKHRNVMGYDPETEELLWWQSDKDGNQSIRYIDPQTLLSHYARKLSVEITSLWQMRKRYEVKLKTEGGEDPDKGTACYPRNGLSSGMFAVGAKVTIEAVPAKGHRFVQWTDGNTDNPRTIEVTTAEGQTDTTFTAVFDWEEGVTGYPIWVCGKQIYTHCLMIDKGSEVGITGGRVLFDPGTNTLILEGVSMSSDAKEIIRIGDGNAQSEPVKVYLMNSTMLTNTNDADGFTFVIDHTDVTFFGPGSLYLIGQKKSSSMEVKGSHVTFEGVGLFFGANNFGLYGSNGAELTIRGSGLMVQGKDKGSLTGFDALHTEYSQLTSPSGAVFQNKSVEVSGNPTKETVYIERTLPQVCAYAQEYGTGSFLIKGDGKEFTNVGWFAKGTSITVEAVPADGFAFSHWGHDKNWGKEDKQADWIGAEYAYEKNEKDETYKALFYYQPKSTATWYSVQNKHFVSFRMDDHAEHPSVSNEPEVSDVTAGDYHDGQWEFAQANAIYSMPFADIENGADLEGKDAIEKIATTTFSPYAMAYDLFNGVMYTTDKKSLYRINYETKKADYVGTFISSYENVAIEVAGMAFDAKGVMYVLRYDDGNARLYRVTEMNKDEGYVSAEPAGAGDGNLGVYISVGIHPIAFDYQTGELFWAENYYMRVIDPVNCKAYICGDYGMSNGVQGKFYSLHCKNAKPSKPDPKPDPQPDPDPEPDPKPDQGVEIVDSGQLTVDSYKVLYEGNLYIMYKGQMYNVQGQRVK